MYLYLVQHAEALSKDIDPERGLSEKGRNDINRISVFVSGLSLNIQEVFHSGKKRALQTAEVLASGLNIKDNVSETEGLAPMDDPDIWFSRIRDLDSDVMLVGHLPHMEKLASLVLCGDRENKIIGFEMGCVVCLKRDDNRNWSVDWIIKPGIIKQL